MKLIKQTTIGGNFKISNNDIKISNNTIKISQNEIGNGSQFYIDIIPRKYVLKVDVSIYKSLSDEKIIIEDISTTTIKGLMRVFLIDFLPLNDIVYKIEVFDSISKEKIYNGQIMMINEIPQDYKISSVDDKNNLKF